MKWRSPKEGPGLDGGVGLVLQVAPQLLHTRVPGRWEHGRESMSGSSHGHKEAVSRESAEVKAGDWMAINATGGVCEEADAQGAEPTLPHQASPKTTPREIRAPALERRLHAYRPRARFADRLPSALRPPPGARATRARGCRPPACPPLTANPPLTARLPPGVRPLPVRPPTTHRSAPARGPPADRQPPDARQSARLPPPPRTNKRLVAPVGSPARQPACAPARLRAHQPPPSYRPVARRARPAL